MQLPAPFNSDLKVIVPAGGDPAIERPHRGREVPLTGKAFLRLRERLVIEYVLDFLRDCGLRRVWVVAKGDHLARVPPRHVFTPVPQRTDATFFDNLVAGCDAAGLAPGEPVLIVFGDHPLNSPAALRLFLSRCAERLPTADFFHAMSLQASYREYGQWFHRTSVHMREMRGRATGLSLATPSRLHGVTKLQALYGVRKLERSASFLRLLNHLARWLGRDAPGSLRDSLLMLAAKEMEKGARRQWVGAEACRRFESRISDLLPAERMERYAARVLEAERGVCFVPIPHGGLAIDVDFAEELQMLDQHWDTIRQIAARQDAALAERLDVSRVTA
jgi:hypothetical protein